MGLLDKLFPKKAQDHGVSGYFRTLSAYTPVFTSRDGGLYEMELTRSAIHAFATNVSKLKPEVTGQSKARLASMLQYQPNPWMTSSQFLYRVATILSVDTTAFIVPLEDGGFFPIQPSRSELADVDGDIWLRYTFSNGQTAAIEWGRVGVLTQFQYKDDFFGSGNSALSPTLDLLDLQRQGMSDGVKQGAFIRFMARIAQTLRPEDISKERERFAADNLASENTSGLLLYDAKFADMKQIESKPFLIDAEQMKLIQTNVYNYFGVNEAILQNSYDEDQWNAFYEGKVEPFALQLGLVMTNMTFTERERSFGNEIMFSSNRLQYASNQSKLNVTTQLMDRGLLSNWGAADLWNLPRPEGDERWVIRGEYIDVNNLPDHTVDQAKSYLQPQPAEPEPKE